MVAPSAAPGIRTRPQRGGKRGDMSQKRVLEAAVFGALLCLGLVLLGVILSRGFVALRALDRTVTVKGLSEREVAADVAIWPIRFELAEDDLGRLAAGLERANAQVLAFLQAGGFTPQEITAGVPAIVDRQAQRYGGGGEEGLRYLGNGTLTVYSTNIEGVRAAMGRLVELGRQGVAIGGQDYELRPEFLFTRLNDIKPDMIEDATRNAREAAEKFARDSDSHLGKIKRAYQGQFTIEDRDSNTPHIKKVRVVATVEYFLSD